ncbi:MAG: RidA family protein, partial [Sphingomonadales bacterium]|nr:RidA family protein [Sphingomonadales bacterium]
MLRRPARTSIQAKTGASAAPAKHFPSAGSPASGTNPAFSAAVEANGTLYISGTTDGVDPATGQKPANASIGAKVVMNNIKRTV